MTSPTIRTPCSQLFERRAGKTHTLALIEMEAGKHLVEVEWRRLIELRGRGDGSGGGWSKLGGATGVVGEVGVEKARDASRCLKI